MRSRAVRAAEATIVGVGNVCLVVWRVQVLSIPAGREDDGCADATRAVLIWELSSVFGITRRKPLAIPETAVANRGFVLTLLVRGVSCDHSETGLECRHLAILGTVRHVVHRHASVLLDPKVGKLGDSLEGTILRGLEVQRGGPIVAEVLRVGASRASRLARQIVCDWFHLRRVSDSLS